MWGIAIIITVIIVVWGVGGSTVPSTGSNGGPPSGQGCESCQNLKHWWYGLTRWQQTWEFVWYWWKRGDCWVRGCSVD
jgi:hypothetical protein